MTELTLFFSVPEQQGFGAYIP